jgi:D-lactate dehydrogenase
MASFIAAARCILPQNRIVTDALRLHAFATDASFYRLTPAAALIVDDEAEVQRLLPIAREHRIGVTFRAAGTSLSGQAVSDSILIVANSHNNHRWSEHTVLNSGAAVRCKPGAIGGQVNASLAPYHVKIGPDPASIESCMIGGIVSNNSSGMCCGVAQNSYNTISSLKLVLTDGTLLDTGDSESRARFRDSHFRMLERLSDMRQRLLQKESFVRRIQKKKSIKNTSGYSLQSFIDYEDPLDILTHLIIGSEGTLAFIAEATFSTVRILPHSANALAVFPSIHEAALAAQCLNMGGVASSAELFDGKSLRSASGSSGMQRFSSADDDTTAVLIETRADTPEHLRSNISRIEGDIRLACRTKEPLCFTDDASISDCWWSARKGIIPIIGKARARGTTLLIEDVAVPIPQLPQLVGDVKSMFTKFGYEDGHIIGHAKDGNIHLVFSQGFSHPKHIAQFDAFMRELSECVAVKHDGSLKAEHGTGRNMAPFLSLEWGREGMELMREVKDIFDPVHILNPGVILNDDPRAHVSNLKQIVPVHPLIDACIECGFCESNCPTRSSTVTPRQRIVLARRKKQIESSLGASAADSFSNGGGSIMSFDDAVMNSCAADGMCATKCPVGINTGDYVKLMRSVSAPSASPALAVLRLTTAAGSIRR